MGETREQELQRRLEAFDAQLAAYRNELSRFERLLIKHNIIDTVDAVEMQADDTAVAVTSTKRKDRYIAGVAVEEPRYSLEVAFAQEGDDIFTEPLFEPTEDSRYQIRIRLAQHHSGIEFQGVTLDWRLPNGWTWADGADRYTNHEFISNPLVISRTATYHYGAAGWRVIVDEWYKSPSLATKVAGTGAVVFGSYGG